MWQEAGKEISCHGLYPGTELVFDEPTVLYRWGGYSTTRKERFAQEDGSQKEERKGIPHLGPHLWVSVVQGGRDFCLKHWSKCLEAARAPVRSQPLACWLQPHTADSATYKWFLSQQIEYDMQCYATVRRYIYITDKVNTLRLYTTCKD